MILAPILLSMTTLDIREESHRLLDRIDERFLTAVHALLRTYEREENAGSVEDDGVIGYRVDTNEAILASEADDTYEAIVTQVKAGNYVEVDELIAEKSARW